MKYNKLIRDKIPEIIEKKGEKVVFHIADKKEYREKLFEKLSEEVKEFTEAMSVDELADLFEVIDAIIVELDMNESEVRKVQKEKREKRGGFGRRVILEES